MRRALFTLSVASTLALACGGDGHHTTDDAGPDLGVDGSGLGDATDAAAPAEFDRDAAAAAILGVAQTDERRLPGLSDVVQVVRTEADIPHIYAADPLDAVRVEGYLVARDRYFEFELGSRLALGTLSELMGDLTLDADVESRGTGMAYVADRILAAASPESMAVLQAYADGINAWVDALRAGDEEPPTELSLVGPLLGVADATSVLVPATPRSVAGFAAFVVFTSSHTFTDLVRDDVAAQVASAYDGLPGGASRRDALIADVWGPIQPLFPVVAAGSAGAKGLGVPAALATAGALHIPDGLRERARDRDRRWRARHRFGPSGDHGSNVWAVAASGATSRAALLAGDGHLSLGIPPIFIQLGIDDRVFGEGSRHQTGLFLPGFPLIGVGTNGSVAWSQTYPRADVTDYYAERVRLGSDGLPDATWFNGEWRAVERHDEVYRVAGTLGRPAAERTAPRWTTFDGRWLIDIEGDASSSDAEGAVFPGLGDWISPRDTDGDGDVTAVSMDFTGFDIGDLISSVDALGSAENVDEFVAATRGFVGYAQNLGAADVDGRVALTSYTATPCRGYLPRAAGGGWELGADPTRVLDGTRFGGFTVPSDAAGRPVEGDPDPYRCLVPFSEWPTSIEPASGFVANANNDPAGWSLDGDLANDPHYIGGPWSIGARADTITRRLAELVADGSATPDAMSELQGDHASRLGQLFGPYLVAALEHAEEAAGAGSVSDSDGRLATLWQADAAALAEARQRIAAWVARGSDAASGVETFYAQPSAEERTDAVATMIFNAWFRAFVRGVFDDESVDFVFQPAELGRARIVTSLARMLEGRGGDNPGGLRSWDPATLESVFFDDLGTDVVERSDEIMVAALEVALNQLRAPRSGDGGGFGTDDMRSWLWGLRHRVRFDSILLGFAAGNPIIELLADDFSITTARIPLAEGLASGDPRRGIVGFPRPGDAYAVDAAVPELSGVDFDYRDGPVMRMVIELRRGQVTGRNIIPGGQSGVVASPHFDDQARLWLANATVPLRHEVEDVVAGASGREAFRP
ncbi:MAG: penicillin acylase family protein [Myxococcales bacterium]|nr:penicillin acylase family protein [Myxococcales bacterium]MCB9521013.1 penicillin acylase family protein [Myxococcales bacterium]MCB9531660.1 penicillin acylase family protein [Myxococcales bacterium]